MIEKSAAFKDGGLIDITFDEGNPPFTYSGNSFNNANAYGPTLGDQPNASAGIAADAAGENLFGKNVAHRADRPELDPGPEQRRPAALPRARATTPSSTGPPVCTQTTPTLVPANCVPGIVRGGSGNSPIARTDAAAGLAGSSYILDSADRSPTTPAGR